MRRLAFALLAVTAFGCSHEGSVSFDPRVSRTTLVTEGRSHVSFTPRGVSARCRRAGSAVRRSLLRRHHDDARLLPAVLSLAAGAGSAPPLFRLGGGGRASGVPAVHAVPAGARARTHGTGGRVPARPGGVRAHRIRSAQRPHRRRSRDRAWR